jgi:mannose/fructose/sorbose-specific phosphotransferase system IIA component
MIGIILLTHGKLSDELFSTCEAIIGKNDYVFCLSNERLSLAELHNSIKSLIEKEKFEDGLLILVELKGGSCWTAAKRIEKEYPNTKVISGVNLPMIFSAITKRDKYNLEELTEWVKNDGIRGILSE